MDKVYVVKNMEDGSYMGVGCTPSIQSSDPLNEPMVAKFMTEEAAFAAMTNWIYPIGSSVIPINLIQDEHFAVYYKNNGSMVYKGFIYSADDPIYHSHLYLRLLRESLHLSSHDVHEEAKISLWSLNMFENDELFALKKCNLYDKLATYYALKLKDHPEPELVKSVASCRLLQYVSEGWFRTSARSHIRILRRCL